MASSFLLQTKVSLVAGLVGASPIWLYEMWAFIMPGLHRNERRWTVVFVSVAGPLVLRRRGARLLRAAEGSAGPDRLHARPGVTNLIDLNDYLSS